MKELVKRCALALLGLSMLVVSIISHAQTMTGISISGPDMVPIGNFMPNVAIYSVVANYSDGSQQTQSNSTHSWMFAMNGGSARMQTSPTFLIGIGGFSTLVLSTTVGGFSASKTIVASASAPVPTTTVAVSSTSTLPTVPPRTPTPINSAITDPLYPFQTSLFTPINSSGGINIDGAWAITTGDPNLVVGIIDMGVLNHADLAGRMLQGYNFVEGANNGLDPGGVAPNTGCFTAWHGTNVAGIVGANANNVGITGINWKSKMLPVRSVQSFMGSCGYAANGSPIQDPNVVAKAVRWASGLSVAGAPDNTTPAKVINISLLGVDQACTSPAMASAVEAAVANGTTVVMAAGNQGQISSNFSLCPNAIWVAGINSDGSKADSSTMGSGVTIAAPDQGGIYSTTDSGTTTPNNSNTYAAFGGTSASAPFVTGVVSLMLSANPTLTPKQVKQMLTTSARTFPTTNLSMGAPCTTSLCGAGIVDASAAVALAAAAPGATVSATKPVSTADCVFNWAEKAYPKYFDTVGSPSSTIAAYYFRHYPGTNTYLGVSTSDNHLVVFSPSFGSSLIDVGPMANILIAAGCQ